MKASLNEFTREEKLKEIEREISQRQWVYRGLVARGKLKQATADRQIAIMSAVANDYRKKIAEGPLFQQGNSL